MQVLQLENGIQKRPYADHIFKWELKADKNETKEEVLKFAFSLRKAEREKEQYLKDYRSSHDFNEKMHIIRGGYYSLQEIRQNVYTYTVVEEYID